MAGTDDPVGTQQGVMPLGLQIQRELLGRLVRTSNELGDARKGHAEAFLLAKLSSRKPTDRQAEASAEVEAGATLLAAETQYFIAKQQYAAALRRKGA